MSQYTPLFNRIVDSSLWEEPLHVRIVFITMLTKRDRDDIVEGSAFNISRWAKVTEEEAMNALKVLSSPDKRRLEPQPFEGRRIERVPGDEPAWLILNGHVYRKILSEMRSRESKAEWARKHRETEKVKGKKKIKKGTPLPGETAYCRAVEAGVSPEELERMTDKP